MKRAPVLPPSGWPMVLVETNLHNPHLANALGCLVVTPFTNRDEPAPPINQQVSALLPNLGCVASICVRPGEQLVPTIRVDRVASGLLPHSGLHVVLRVTSGIVRR